MNETSSGLKFGVHYTGSVAKTDVVAYARRLESLGYDGFWVTENARGREPLLVLATAAAVTDLDIGTGVLLLPLRHPTLLARELATLDRLSDGRLIVGVGVGGERAPDFDAYGIARKERGARADESLELMRRLWSEHDVSYDGRFYKIDGTTLDVRPAQQPSLDLGRWQAGGQGIARRCVEAHRPLRRRGCPYLITRSSTPGLQRLANTPGASETPRPARRPGLQ
jgi:alkanesulfonate monooxygenase SsuD/methylene tetrahydromethanopterin reductase-like flavin-dependent oxidoreductase (luciferase family)